MRNKDTRQCPRTTTWVFEEKGEPKQTWDVSLAGAASNIIFVVRVCVCRDNHTFVATKDMFVATKESLSRQKFCHKWQFCRDKSLSRQAYFCRDKKCLAATKMILVAAPANDREEAFLPTSLRPNRWAKPAHKAEVLQWSSSNKDHWKNQVKKVEGRKEGWWRWW